MEKYRFLWADDEIDSLKPHILFLEKKGYTIVTVNNGYDAIKLCEKELFDIVFLDEQMIGITGLEVLGEIKKRNPNLSVVMITKSEEEHIMETAIGSQISDYLIKPVHPNQILSTVKKIIDQKRLVTEVINMNYQKDFQSINFSMSDTLTHKEWIEIYKKLVYWDLEIQKTEDKSMYEILESQKTQANALFAKFIKKQYPTWLKQTNAERPLMIHELFKKKVFPLLKTADSVFVIVIDNLRYDQWEMIEPILSQYFTIQEKELFFSILPTTTAYARNSLFSGLLPSDMGKEYPGLWVSESDDDEGKNNHESEFLKHNLQRNKIDIRYSYNKIIKTNQGISFSENIHNIASAKLNVIIYNFVDMLSHAKTDNAMIQELAHDEAAYRSIVSSWVEHSHILETLKAIAEKKAKVIITTDHGTVMVKKPIKIIGYKETNTNLRYKQGKNLSYVDSKVVAIPNPESICLPKTNLSTSFVFATEDYFFAYPNNYNQYVNLYKNTFQHGGISLEEMIIPLILMEPK
ncbi:MAG: PglZ domain-containing protein [Chitinophagaceae bacterium]|nr:PglZ domain-containing protein [Chitinophagaceae bacterium]